MIRNKEILGDWTLPGRCGIFFGWGSWYQYPTKLANVPWKNRWELEDLITFRLEFVCSYLGDIRSFSGMYTFFDPKVNPPIFFWKFAEKSRLTMRRLLMATLSWVRENPKVVVYCPLFSSRERNVAEVRSAVVFCCQPNLKNMSQNAESFPIFQVNIQKNYYHLYTPPQN